MEDRSSTGELKSRSADDVIPWRMDGDPAICWQTLRDLLDALVQKYSGKTFFEMEKIGGPSRWNTLRALRVLRWWNALG